MAISTRTILAAAVALAAACHGAELPSCENDVAGACPRVFSLRTLGRCASRSDVSISVTRPSPAVFELLKHLCFLFLCSLFFPLSIFASQLPG